MGLVVLINQGDGNKMLPVERSCLLTLLPEKNLQTITLKTQHLHPLQKNKPKPTPGWVF